MRRWWKAIAAVLFLLLGWLRGLIEVIGDAQTVSDLPIYLKWLISPYVSLSAIGAGAVFIGWLYYDHKIRRGSAGFLSDPQDRKGYLIKATIAVACVMVVFIGIPIAIGHWKHKSDQSSQGHNVKEALSKMTVINVSIGMDVSDKKQPGANVTFQNEGPETAKWAIHSESIITGDDFPSDHSKIDELEDIWWEMTKVGAKLVVPTTEARPKKAIWTTLIGYKPTPDQLAKIRNYQKRLYFMAILKYRDRASDHEEEICVFWTGDQHVVHYCHSHNS